LAEAAIRRLPKANGKNNDGKSGRYPVGPPMNTFLRNFLTKTIRKGTLEIVSADGSKATFGDRTGKPVRLRFTSAEAERNDIMNPQLKLGEEFMDGGFVIDEGSIYDFLVVILSNVQGVYVTWWMKAFGAFGFATRRLAQFNTPLRSRKNVASHYDLDGRLYSLFLDNDLQYSCAFFEPGNADLEEAQVAKKRHLAAKLRLEPGRRVLDLGAGGGGHAV
jgi:cyclopropane-fatty-acyl-phospholipid synthase